MRQVAFLVGLLFVLGLGLSLRLSNSDLEREIRPGDEATYHNAAISLLERGVITRDPEFPAGSTNAEATASLSPGYPLFVATIYSIAGERSPPRVFAVQLLLSVASLGLVALICSQIGVGSAGTLIATLACALYPGLIYNNDRLLTEPLFVFLLLCAASAFIASIGKRPSVGWALVAGLLFGLGAEVRTQALPLAMLAVIVLAAFGQASQRDKLAASASLVVGVVAAFVPYWVYSYNVLGELLLLPSAGDGPRIWGAVPYYLDMASTSGLTLQEVEAHNSVSNPGVYWRWRIFGFLNFMFADVWDESLVHATLMEFVWLQYLIVVPVFAGLPVLVLKGTRRTLFVAGTPLLFVLAAMPFHGLPRYLVPVIPFIFIGAAALVDNRSWTSAAPSRLERPLRYLGAGGGALLGAATLYSVFVFAWSMGWEQSVYRLARYMEVKPGVALRTPLDEQRFPPEVLKPANVLPKTMPNTYEMVGSGPIVIDLVIPDLPRPARIVTEVTLNFHGGYPYDYAVLYWNVDGGPSFFDDNRFYKLPINAWQKQQQVLIDGDVTSLKLIPIRFAEGVVELGEIIVRKFRSGR